ncbi:MAG: hypothetical protein WA056_13280 [Gallionella sp.]
MSNNRCLLLIIAVCIGVFTVAATENIDDLNKAIQSLPALLDSISSLPISGWVVLFVLFLWLLANNDFSRVLDFFERKEKRKLEALDSYVASPNTADAKAIKAISDLRDAHYFKIATGIYAESRLRNAIIKLHEATSHLVTWRHIRLALPHLDVDVDESVAVKGFSLADSAGYRYNQFVGYTFLLFAATLISLVILSGSKTLESFVLGFGSGIASAFFAMFVFSQNWPIDAAKKISAELERQKNAVENAQIKR